MKQGMTLVDMATTLEAQRATKRDFVADTRKLTMDKDAKSMQVGTEKMELLPLAKTQLAGKLDIPVGFYQRLEERHPDVLAYTVNTLFDREPAQHMVRTLDAKVRAVLSTGYRQLDNYDLFEAVYPALCDSGALVESCNLSDTLMHIKARMPWLDRELPLPAGFKVGEGHNWYIRKIEGALTIRNSDVGLGGLSVLPGSFEKACTNLVTFKEDGLVKVHIGRKTDATETVKEYITAETQRLADAAFWSTVRDTIKAFVDGKAFEKFIERMVAARGDVIDADPAKVVAAFAEQKQLTQDEQGGLLRHLVGSGEMTRYGLQWAVTRLSQDVTDYDRATEFERLGGQVIEMPKSDWTRLLKAA